MEKMCRILKVSSSGYYQWKTKPESRRSLENKAIYEALKASYDKNKGRVGLNKMLDDVKEEFPYCGRNRLYKIQKKYGLYSIRKRKFKATTNSKHNYAIAPNLLNRNFCAAAPNQAWVTDISYIGTDEGWLYLAVIKDLYDKQIVGYATGDRITSELCAKALKSAVLRHKPPEGIIHHSDRGIQYASNDYQGLLRENRMICL